MVRYYIQTEKGKEFITNIDYSQGTLEFTLDGDKAYKDRDGYYATPTKEFIIHNFAEKYPQVKALCCEGAY